MRASPSEDAPEEGSGYDSQKPTENGDDPENGAAGGNVRGFGGAEPDAKLRAGDQVARDGSVDGAQTAEDVLRGSDFLRAGGADVEMRAEPGLIVGREAFD